MLYKKNKTRRALNKIMFLKQFKAEEQKTVIIALYELLSHTMQKRQGFNSKSKQCA